jgi:hypothetical protein
MSPRLLEHVHGHLAVLATAALLHPAWLLRDPRRRARWAASLATASVTLAAALGAWLYPAYRKQLKKPIFLSDFAMGLLFERKEHLAFAAVALAWAGLFLHLSVRDGSPRSLARARAAHWSFVGAAMLAVVTALLGVRVATFRSF